MEDKPKIDFSKLESYSVPSNEWKVRHHDGATYGRYTWDQVQAFSLEGRISLDHQLMNPAKTQGQWVLASRFKAIVEAIEQRTCVAPPSVSAPVVQRNQPTQETLVTNDDAGMFEAITKAQSKPTRRQGRSSIVLAIHVLTIFWMLVPILISLAVGIDNAMGIVHWLSTGGIPGIGRDEGMFRFLMAIPVYVHFMFPALLLSLGSEVLYTLQSTFKK